MMESEVLEKLKWGNGQGMECFRMKYYEIIIENK